MPLKLLPLPQSERQLYFQICGLAFVPGIIDIFYPYGLTEAAQQHGVASIKRANDQYPDRAHFLRIIDTDLPENDPYKQVVGVSQWRIFPRERSEDELKREGEEAEKDDEEFGHPPGLSVAAVEEFHGICSEYRKKHLGRSPHVILQAIATRPGHERRGIAATALAWGTQKADEMGVPVYLEGSPKGVELYKRWGFEVVDVLPFDARRFGYHDALQHMCMKRPPTSKAP